VAVDQEAVGRLDVERLARSTLGEVAMALHWIDGSDHLDDDTALRHARAARDQLTALITLLER